MITDPSSAPGRGFVLHAQGAGPVLDTAHCRVDRRGGLKAITARVLRKKLRRARPSAVSVTLTSTPLCEQVDSASAESELVWR